MEFVKVADAAELVLGQMKGVSVDGRTILLANVQSRFYAIENRCTHMGGALCNGTLDGTVVTCPRHGAQFDVRTGKAVGNARTLFRSRTVADVARFDVMIDQGCVYIEIDEHVQPPGSMPCKAAEAA
jgi:3-phenylpropionate/trans-cinnamate dioxygenase ferredoxin subunit